MDDQATETLIAALRRAADAGNEKAIRLLPLVAVLALLDRAARAVLPAPPEA